MNLLPPTVLATGGDALLLQVDGVGELAMPPQPGWRVGAKALLSFRPHTLRLAANDGLPDTRLAWWPATVVASEYLGSFTRHGLQVGSARVVAEQPHHGGQAPQAVHSAVRLGLDRAQLRLLPA